MREVLQRHLGPPGDSALRVRECRIVNTRRRDGSRGTVEYDLRVEECATGRVWDQKVTGVTYGGERTRRVWESISRAAPLRHAAVSGAALAPFSYVPELDLLLQVFPHDHRLPAIAALMAGPPPALVPAILAEFGSGAWTVQEWHAETVQYRVDMRAILRLSVRAADHERGGNAEHQWYAKVYRDVEAARRSHRLQTLLHERATAAHGLLTIARPVALLDGLQTVVTESLPGASLARIIRRGEGLMPAVRSAAKAVSEFHKLDVDAPQRPVADDVARLREAEDTVRAARPDLAPDVADLVNAVVAGLDAAPTAIIHGDLKPEHILIDGDRIALIDFDLCAAADPVIDVAHLIAFLGASQERARSRREQPASAAQVFVEEYFAHAPAAWRARLPLYHAMTGIHRAAGLCRRRGPGGQERVESVLREGHALLAGEAGEGVPSYKRRITRSAVR